MAPPKQTHPSSTVGETPGVNVADATRPLKDDVLNSHSLAVTDLSSAAAQEQLEHVAEALASLQGGAKLPVIHVLSDAHLESGPYQVPAELNCDIVVAAGDIGPVELSVPWLAKLGKPVVYVLGNHESYGKSPEQALAQAKELSQGTQVHVLENEAIELMGVRFLGTTLWTSYGNWSSPLVRNAFRRMNDYVHIQAGDWLAQSAARQKEFWSLCKKAGLIHAQPAGAAPLPEKFHPAMAYMRHKRAVKWLNKELSKACEKSQPVVVVTHHAPALDCLAAKGVGPELLEERNWEVNARNDKLVYVAAYASDLKGLFAQHGRKIDLWAHGHIHAGQDLLVQGVRVLANPRGRYHAPLTQESAKEFALFGVHFTQEDIERSQAQAKANPYQGDALAFEPALRVSLVQGPQRPLKLMCEPVMPVLQELKDQAKALVPLVGKGKPLQAQAVARWLRTCVDEFEEGYSGLLTRAFAHMHQFGWAHSLSAPGTQVPAPYLPYCQSQWDEKALAPLDAQAQKALAMLERLPYLTQWFLLQWTRQALKGLALLDAKGLHAKVRMPEKLAWRRLDRSQLSFVVNVEDVCNLKDASDGHKPAGRAGTVEVDVDLGPDESEEQAVCLGLEVELDKAINGQPPRDWFISVSCDTTDWQGRALPRAFDRQELEQALAAHGVMVLPAPSLAEPQANWPQEQEAEDAGW